VREVVLERREAERTQPLRESRLDQALLARMQVDPAHAVHEVPDVVELGIAELRRRQPE
jgi:hypothetical protein